MLLGIILSACNLPARTGSPTQTIDQNLAGNGTATTLQVIPAQTPMTILTPTDTVPMMLFEGSTNCRKGPGTGYDVITVVLNGQKAEAIGVSEKGDYWLIKNPIRGDPCWVTNDLAKPSGSFLQLPTVTAPATPTLIPPNTPVWSVYNYTCELATGGGNMTMNLAWNDRSNNEEGYTVYRDKQAIATLAPNSTFYVDVAFIANGQTRSYSVEVFSKDWRASTSTIAYGCQ